MCSKPPRWWLPNAGHGSSSIGRDDLAKRRSISLISRDSIFLIADGCYKLLNFHRNWRRIGLFLRDFVTEVEKRESKKKIREEESQHERLSLQVSREVVVRAAKLSGNDGSHQQDPSQELSGGTRAVDERPEPG